jgi:hypothetical protein
MVPWENARIVIPVSITAIPIMVITVIVSLNRIYEATEIITAQQHIADIVIPWFKPAYNDVPNAKIMQRLPIH